MPELSSPMRRRGTIVSSCRQTRPCPHIVQCTQALFVPPTSGRMCRGHAIGCRSRQSLPCSQFTQRPQTTYKSTSRQEPRQRSPLCAVDRHQRRHWERSQRRNVPRLSHRHRVDWLDKLGSLFQKTVDSVPVLLLHPQQGRRVINANALPADEESQGVDPDALARRVHVENLGQLDRSPHGEGRHLAVFVAKWRRPILDGRTWAWASGRGASKNSNKSHAGEVKRGGCV